MRARQAFLLSMAVLTLLPAAVRAAPARNGVAFNVSNCATCKKRLASVAGVASGTGAGTFVASWESTSPADPFGITGRFFTKTAAPRGADALVNKDTVPQQSDPAVATDSQGNAVVVWAAKNGPNTDVLGQRYKATGAVNGPAFVVNVDTPGAPVPAVDAAPTVAMAANGTFTVSWIRSVPPGATSPAEDPAVMVRRYSAAGVPLGAPAKISTGLVARSKPEACIDTTGRAVVAWTTVDGFHPFEPDKNGVALRRVATAGAPLDAVIVVAPPTASDSSTAVVCGAGGTFIVIWSTNLAPAVTGGSDIVAQRFTNLARRNGAVFRLNSVTVGDQNLPAASADASGNFVVAWQSHIPGSPVLTSDAVVGRRFLASATADGADFVVRARTTKLEERPITPDVANLGATGFVIVWSQGNLVLQGQRYKLGK